MNFLLQKVVPHPKTQKKNKAAARKKRMKELIQASQGDSESDDSDDELIPKKILRLQKCQTQRVIAENRSLHEKLETERALCVELQRTLLKKMCVFCF